MTANLPCGGVPGSLSHAIQPIAVLATPKRRVAGSFWRSRRKQAVAIEWNSTRSTAVPPSDLEGYADVVAIAPDQAALPDGAKIIEGQIETQRQNWQILGPNASPDICDVSDQAEVHADN